MAGQIGISGVSCGGCCHQSYPCERCLKDTLLSNGIPETELDNFKGLAKTSGFGSYPWEGSPLANEIKKYLKQEIK